MKTKTFPAKIKKTGNNSLGITIPSTIRDEFELGKVYTFIVEGD